MSQSDKLLYSLSKKSIICLEKALTKNMKPEAENSLYIFDRDR